MQPTALNVAHLMGEVHYLVVSSCLLSDDGWLSSAQLHRCTGLSAIDMHHALAELQRLGVVRIDEGCISVERVLKVDVALYLKSVAYPDCELLNSKMPTTF